VRRLSRRSWLGGALAAGGLAVAPRFGTAAGAGTPWRNWSGGVFAQPAGRFAPTSEAELADFLASHRGALRPVGSGHSFSPLVPTDGHLVVLEHLAGLIDHDAETRQATFWAGTRLGEMGAPLEAAGQAMFNLPDIDRQTLAGAIATATHGTGIAFNTLSAYVTGMRLVTATGEVLDLDASHQGDVFAAAKVGLGALGVVTRVRLQNRSPYRLRERTWFQRTDEVLEDFDAKAATHRHFEMFPLTHSQYAIVLEIDETDAPVANPPVSPEEDAAFDSLMRGWHALPPAERRAAIDATVEGMLGPPSEVVDVSYKVLANVRNYRFNEMEYSVPIDAGAACLREILRTIEERRIDVVFPLEYRYIKGDDLWLSMFSGGDRAAISIHQDARFDWRPYFDVVEPIFWKYEGRPHWGKINSLGHVELAKLYPRFEDFRAIRQALDPTGRFLNDHLRRQLGVGA
jgi:FAD-linked oxidoreductase